MTAQNAPPKGDSCILPFIWPISPQMCFLFFFFPFPRLLWEPCQTQSEPKSLLCAAWSSYCVSSNCTLCICWGRIRGHHRVRRLRPPGTLRRLQQVWTAQSSPASVHHEVRWRENAFCLDDWHPLRLWTPNDSASVPCRAHLCQEFIEQGSSSKALH